MTKIIGERLIYFRFGKEDLIANFGHRYYLYIKLGSFEKVFYYYKKDNA